MNYVCTFTDENCIDNILRVWLPTLQKNFSGKIVVITFGVTDEHIKELQKQDVTVIKNLSDVSGMYKVISKRLEAQEKFIKTLKTTDKIMLIDGSDVVFQTEIDSFFDKIGDKIIYSTTGTLTNKPTIQWMKKMANNHPELPIILDKIKKEEVIASGMLAGTKKSFIKYFRKHKKAVNKFKVKYFTGLNQAILTYLIIKNSNDFTKTDIHNCRVLNNDVIKQNGIYKINKTIPIIHFSCSKMKKIYKESYLSNSVNSFNTKNSLNILWMYGSVPKFDIINHWYHTGFARVIANMPNVNLMLYGRGMHKINPDLAKIPFNDKMTGLDIKKEFDFDVIIMDNKNRFVYSQTLAERRAKKPRTFWLKPEFFDNLNNIPKVFLEGDYHLHFRVHPEEKDWLRDRKIDLLLVRHLSALDYHKDKTIPIKWFPCSVNTDIFKPNDDIPRKNKLCLISGYGINYYSYRNTAGGMLEPDNLINIYPKRFIGDDYIRNLQSYICHLSGSSIRAITPAKMFEIMASGSLLFTDEGWEYGLKELFPDDSYCTYNKVDYSDVISKAKKIINEPAFRKYTTTKALRCIKEKHTHEVRGKELIDMIVKSFGITYISGGSKNVFGRIEEFFKKGNININSIPVIRNEIKTVEEIVTPEVIAVPDKPSILPTPAGNKKLIALKNEEKLKKLYNKKVDIYILKDTCYNIIFNDKVGNTLDIAVDKQETARGIVGEVFDFEAQPAHTKQFIYKGMILHVPCPLINYLTTLYGRDIVEKLKSRKKRLRLIHNVYKFRNRG